MTEPTFDAEVAPAPVLGSLPDPSRPELSIVIPLFNEEENLPELARRLGALIESVDYPTEVVFVNDGSSDRTMELLRAQIECQPAFRVIDFSRNFGHQAAMYAGLKRAAGRAVVLMDGDLQDPPEIVPQLVERWREGYEVVHAIRRKRKEGILKRMAYAVYYRLLKTAAYIPVTVDSGDFSLMDRRVVDLIRSMPERNKFLRGLRSWVGFRQTELEYERDARYAGTPKYTVSKLFRLALDGMVSYSFVPLRISYAFGFIVAGGSFILGFGYLFARIFGNRPIPQGFTTLAILILFLGGIQLLAVGMLGEYIGRIYDEVKRRPEYVERELLGFPPPPEK